MARTLNTMPYELQMELLGRDHHEVCSQRDLRVISKVRKSQNRHNRAKDRQALRNGRYDDLPTNGTSRRNARWLAW